ncbi:MAG: BREX-1 system adenine-specific DNA-methyltransferase PglX [Lachnospiraceae bacterium]|nr:BREX-1 system adenine-specific DNA-methyltransferase PglX [Lachnospiraceae bacterium]
MDKGILQRYSTWAKVNLENQIEVSLKSLGINGDDDIKKAKLVGDVMTIEGDPTSYPAGMFGKRKDIIDLVTRNGYRNVIEEFAYTWFNRFVALRFMEVHGFLDHGFRVLSNTSGGIEPEILKNLNHVKNELRLDIDLCNEYKQQGKIEELFRHVLIKQCNVLSGILPMLFSSDLGYLELLLPKTLLKGETVITRLVEIPEDVFLEDIEIIGWMYQFYISSKKDEVYASKKTITKDTLPAVTQLFTPDWIVRYMAENTVGRLWLESYPDSSLHFEMKYYVEDAEQTEDVRKKIDEIKYKNVNPEEIRIIEPCCGSGHILVYVFDLLYKMYEERGYQKRDIPTLILKNNLVGLDVDKRAAQLASFSLIMKARSVNNRFFNDQYYVMPLVYEIQDSKLLEELEYRKHLKDLNLLNDEETKLIHYLVDTFENGKTIGSLLKVKPIDFACVDGAFGKISKAAVTNLFNIDFLNIGMKRLRELSDLAKVLSTKYDVMITNPPYINPSSMEAIVKEYATKEYPDSKTDMFAMFMETGFVKPNGYIAMINMHSWMFLASYEKLRKGVANSKSIINMVHLGARAFEAIAGEVVQTTSFVFRNEYLCGFKGTFCRLVDAPTQQDKEAMFLSDKNRYIVGQDVFAKIPGNPIAYWLSNQVVRNFDTMKTIGDYGNGRIGLVTGDAGRFIRFWHEVAENRIGFGIKNNDESIASKKRWFPIHNGGEFRKWFGNLDSVVNWENDGYEMKFDNYMGKRVRSHNYNGEYAFARALSWTTISTGDFCCRYADNGFIFDTAGPFYVSNKQSDLLCIMAFLESKVASMYLRVLNPTINYPPGYIQAVPFDDACISKNIDTLAEKNIATSRDDWNSFETAWDFKMHPLIGMKAHSGLISEIFTIWSEKCQERFTCLKQNEIELNRMFIDIYGLQDELTPEVDDKDVTVRLADKERDIRSLISYFVGVAMGRYSLDVPGLAYAGGEWDVSKYVSYQPDDDGIIPIYNGIGMQTDIRRRYLQTKYRFHC